MEAVMHSAITRHVALISALLLLANCDGKHALAPDAVAVSRAPGGGGGPAAPSNLTASGVVRSRIDLAWQDNSPNETSFEVQRSATGAGGPFFSLGTTSANVTAYTDSGLAPLTQYCYQLRALKTSGPNTSYSAFSNSACATTLPPLAPPAAPSDLKAVANSGGEMVLSWTDHASDETGFDVERCQGVGCTTFTVIT